MRTYVGLGLPKKILAMSMVKLHVVFVLVYLVYELDFG